LASLINFFTLESLDLLEGFLPLYLILEITLFISFLIAGLGDEVPQTNTEINLNLSACFKGDLLRSVYWLKRCRFRMVSYSPDTILIAEHLTEAFTVASFSGQPNCPLFI